jgi:phosphoadenosine phosphosulfate reductase
MPLDHTMDASMNILEQVLAMHGPERTVVAWTGGKDSTIVLWLWKNLLRQRGLGPVRAINLDTGLKFPQVLALRDALTAQWDIVLHVQKPTVQLRDYPVAEDKLACCRDLKVQPLQTAMAELDVRALVTGVRRDEHPSRADRETFESRRDPEHLQVNPILDWTEMDIWACTLEHGLPYCRLYDAGYRSLGCMPCTRPASSVSDDAERSGRAPDKENHLDTLRSLGYF